VVWFLQQQHCGMEFALQKFGMFFAVLVWYGICRGFWKSLWLWEDYHSTSRFILYLI
jgi:hypothetical protein